ncbi:primase-helicase family protein [Shimia thalassica]|uniref:primase-helicase family protein n=1 Tax=Shimia thalassica TaxID=1715693 RepID=UPI0026E3640C|nr:primase-helicase family protein [Shimia thalassica]MDO6800805.1 DUF5906 domain-containing protein [Shimia thalassica]
MNEMTMPTRRRRRVSAVKQAQPVQLLAMVKPLTKEDHPEQFEALTQELCRQISVWFVRDNNHYRSVTNLGMAINQTAVKRLCVHRFSKQYPDFHIEENTELLRAVFQRALEEIHDDPTQTVPIWNGSTRCCPEASQAIIREGEMVAVNTWKPPTYRSLAVQDSDTSMLDTFLEKIFPQEVDRRVCKDWLAWCLQNEADKPAWALFLYSRKKGTGKSTFCHLATRLFGQDNTITQNSVSKLTGRFNKPLLDSKLVVSEELNLKPDSPHGNTLKTYITEKVTASEGKGREVERVRQCCCFLFTTNHIPLWIEADERRYYVIDVDHSGHASGPDAEAFGDFIGELNRWMENDENIARLYHGLMGHQVSNDFNPRSLNLSQIETPIMKQIMTGTREVLLDRLEEKLVASGRFAISQEQLAKLFVEELKTSQNRIRHMMPELGWHQVQAKWGAVDYRRTVWVHRDYQVAGGRVRGPDEYDEPVNPVEEEIDAL